jgi:rhodanese-related sulfurtransferase
MTQNMSSYDRFFRLVIAGVIAYLLYTGALTGATGTVLMVLAIVFAGTSFVGVCPLYLPFGFSTRKKRLPMNKQSTIIDVRTPAEFQSGHVANSINIPLQDIEKRLPEIKKLQQPLVLCCASGNRSARATTMLKNEGLDCQNGGGWLEVKAALLQSAE